MCTDATWIHNKLNAYFHSRDTEEFGEQRYSSTWSGVNLYRFLSHKPSRACICVPMDLLHMYHMKLLKVFGLRRCI